jgi:hypothetical protein
MIGKKLFMIGGTAMFFNPKKHGKLWWLITIDQELWEHYFKPWAYIQAKSIRHPQKAKSYVLSPNNYCNSNNIQLNDRKLNPHPS